MLRPHALTSLERNWINHPEMFHLQELIRGCLRDGVAPFFPGGYLIGNYAISGNGLYQKNYHHFAKFNGNLIGIAHFWTDLWPHQADVPIGFGVTARRNGCMVKDSQRITKRLNGWKNTIEYIYIAMLDPHYRNIKLARSPIKFPLNHHELVPLCLKDP